MGDVNSNGGRGKLQAGFGFLAVCPIAATAIHYRPVRGASDFPSAAAAGAAAGPAASGGPASFLAEGGNGTHATKATSCDAITPGSPIKLKHLLSVIQGAPQILTSGVTFHKEFD